MKKMIVLAITFVLLAAPAFAGGPYVLEEIVSGSEVISVLSNKVQAYVVASDEAYAANTAHTAGSKTFGSSSTTTKLFSSTDALAEPSDSGSGQYADWQAL